MNSETQMKTVYRIEAVGWNVIIYLDNLSDIHRTLGDYFDEGALIDDFNHDVPLVKISVTSIPLSQFENLEDYGEYL